MNIAYVRVSSVDQNEGRQIEGLKKYNIDKWYIEKVSGKDTNRPQLQEMLDFVRDNDNVFILSFDRLARNTKDLLEIVEFLQNKNVHLISDKEHLDSSTPAGKLMLTMLGAIAEFERECIRERQLSGIAIAKKEGKFKGRQVKAIDENTFNKFYEQYKNREINKGELAAALKISRPTLDKLLKDKGL